MSLEDDAQAHELREWRNFNEGRPRLKFYAPGEPGYGPEMCVRCDDEMPDVRRSMGAKLCTSCQREKELRSR